MKKLAVFNLLLFFSVALTAQEGCDELCKTLKDAVKKNCDGCSENDSTYKIRFRNEVSQYTQWLISNGDVALGSEFKLETGDESSLKLGFAYPVPPFRGGSKKAEEKNFANFNKKDAGDKKTYDSKEALEDGYGDVYDFKSVDGKDKCKKVLTNYRAYYSSFFIGGSLDAGVEQNVAEIFSGNNLAPNVEGMLNVSYVFRPWINYNCDDLKDDKKIPCAISIKNSSSYFFHWFTFYGGTKRVQNYLIDTLRTNGKLYDKEAFYQGKFGGSYNFYWVPSTRKIMVPGINLQVKMGLVEDYYNPDDYNSATVEDGMNFTTTTHAQHVELKKVKGLLTQSKVQDSTYLAGTFHSHLKLNFRISDGIYCGLGGFVDTRFGDKHTTETDAGLNVDLPFGNKDKPFANIGVKLFWKDLQTKGDFDEDLKRNKESKDLFAIQAYVNVPLIFAKDQKKKGD